MGVIMRDKVCVDRRDLRRDNYTILFGGEELHPPPDLGKYATSGRGRDPKRAIKVRERKWGGK